jgi:DNA-binding response OmpR family regulator
MMPVEQGSPHASLRVLIVDDSPDVRASLALLVEMNGHEVSRAGDGKTALALAQQRPPEVALLDIGLSGMNGYDLASAPPRTAVAPAAFPGRRDGLWPVGGPGLLS